MDKERCFAANTCVVYVFCMRVVRFRIGGVGDPPAQRTNSATADVLSMQEQEILASIQELQRQLWEVSAVL